MPTYHELARVMFRSAGVRPRSFLDVDNIDAANRMVQEELGVALLPRSAVQAELRSQQLRAITVTDMTPVRRMIIAVRRRDAEPATGPLATFLELLVMHAPKVARPPFDQLLDRPIRVALWLNGQPVNAQIDVAVGRIEIDRPWGCS